MASLLNMVFNVGVSVSIIATVIGLGLMLTLAQLVAPLKRVGTFALLIIANGFLVPVAVWALTQVMPLTDEKYGDGIVLASIAAGGAASLKALQVSGRGDMPLALSAVVVLQLTNVITVPLWAGRIVEGANLSVADTVRSLFLLVLLPLIVGLILRRRVGQKSMTWIPNLTKVANIALLAAIAAGVAVNFETLVSLVGSGALLTAALSALVCVAIGALVGIGGTEARISVTLVTGTRFASLGLIVIATQLDNAPEYAGPAIVYALFEIMLVLAIGGALAKRRSGVTATPGAVRAASSCSRQR